MKYHFPVDLERIIEEHSASEPGDEQNLAKAVLELSDLFLGKAPWRSEYSRAPRLRSAYLRYYLPVNLPKLRVPLTEWLRARPRRLSAPRFRCLDLGCGPGTALLGLCDFIRALPDAERPRLLELTALDQCYDNLKDAAALVSKFARTIPGLSTSFEPLRTDLVVDRSELFSLASAQGPYDLIVAENVLCELERGADGGVDEAFALVAAAAERVLSPTGAIVLIEPGLRDTSRNLHRLRDRLLSETALQALAPCLHQAPCPALALARDWCIADLPWAPPALVAAVDRRTGFAKGSLKFSYLLLAPGPVAAPAATRWRVVSDVLDHKGERRVYLCADGRWIVLAALKRERGEAAETIAALRRGDLVDVDGLEPKGSLYRLAPHGSIRRIDATELPRE